MSDIRIGIVGCCGLRDFEDRTGGKQVKDIDSAMQKDILIFSGGEDISPSLYGERDRHCSYVNGYRDAFESAVFFKALNKGIKMLGVCRGHQLINALLGGKLYQDITIEAKIYHTQQAHIFMPNPEFHWKNKVLSTIFSSVNSLHHQSVRVPGRGLDVILRATDGIVEATANKSGSIVSFQFHPEWLPAGKTYLAKVAETGQLIW